MRFTLLALLSILIASAAEKAVPADAKSSQSYNDQAAALCRQARDLEDVTLYDQAQAAIDLSLKLAPGNFEAGKLQVSVWTGKHEYSKALKLANDLNHKVPDDIAVWGLLVDLYSALGDYTEAERAAQWILDLRRNSSLGFTKAATLRETFGDFTGAIEFYEEANRRTPLSDLSERAWLLTRLARLQMLFGKPARAGELLTAALQLYPNSQLALAETARLRAYEGNDKEAASLYERRYRAVPSTANLYDWAQALAKAGDQERAAALFQEFEKKARENRELLFYYADVANHPAEALTAAEKEMSIRHDWDTLDAHAWALYRNGRFKDAKAELDQALSAGVRDPMYFCHAARIASALGDSAAATNFETESKRLNPRACPAERSAR